MKKIFALILSLAMLLALIPAGVLAQGEQPMPIRQDGRLIIAEAGTYTLTGSLKGMVYVDPGIGDVTLILDNMTIQGGTSAGIVAVSGDSLTLDIAENSHNTIIDGTQNTEYNAAIYSQIPTRIKGNGTLEIQGQGYGIRMNNAYLTYDSSRLDFQTTQRISSNAPIIDSHKEQAVADSAPNAAEEHAASNIAQEEQPVETVTENTEVPARAEADSQNTEVPAIPETNSQNTEVPAKAETDSQNTEVPAKPETNSQNVEVPAKAETDNQNTEVPARPETNSQNEAAPARPDTDNQDSSRPSAPGGDVPGSQSSGMPGGNASGSQSSGMHGGMNNSQNGQSQNVTYAEEPTEIVTSSVENTAAALEADLENATTYVMSDEDNQVKITSSGTYVVTGSSSSGNITVKKGTTGVVLVLEDLDLTSTTGATVSVNKQAEVKIIISGDVTLTDNENPEDEDSEDEEVADAYDGAALKVKADSQVYITGDGTLTINGNAKNGIKGGDDSSIVVDGEVTINITAANDGMNSNYDITLLNGEFTIEAGDDAIHADHILTVGSEDGTGPSIHITSSYEGLEATVVNIFVGDIDLTSSDDGINAANSDATYEDEMDYSINMTGGTVNINAGGDGLDSNGNINLIGGDLSIHSASMGGEAGIDYDGSLYVSDDMNINNASGVAGPDEMPGGMNGQMSGGNMNDNVPGDGNNQPNGSIPEQNGNQQNGTAPAQGNQQPNGCIPEQDGNQQPGNQQLSMENQQKEQPDAPMNMPEQNQPADSSMPSMNMPEQGQNQTPGQNGQQAPDAMQSPSQGNQPMPPQGGMPGETPDMPEAPNQGNQTDSFQPQNAPGQQGMMPEFPGQEGAELNGQGMPELPDNQEIPEQNP